MFEKEYVFKGIHAEKVIKLTANFNKDNDLKLFKRNIDVYMVAPIIGFLYSRTVEIDKSNQETTKIFPEQLIKEKSNLQFIYRLIMLLDTNNEINFDNRLDKAFRYVESNKTEKDEFLFNGYVLGGVEVLYEKLIENSNSQNDYLSNLVDFLEEFDDRYNSKVSTDHLLDLCELARL